MVPDPDSNTLHGYTFTVDWWSLGIVLYECATNEVLFNIGDNSNLDFIGRTLRTEIDFFRIFEITDNFGLLKIIHGLLKVDPLRRLGNYRLIFLLFSIFRHCL